MHAGLPRCHLGPFALSERGEDLDSGIARVYLERNVAVSDERNRKMLET
jgi:hypothetical protein